MIHWGLRLNNKQGGWSISSKEHLTRSVRKQRSYQHEHLALLIPYSDRRSNRSQWCHSRSRIPIKECRNKPSFLFKGVSSSHRRHANVDCMAHSERHRTSRFKGNLLVLLACSINQYFRCFFFYSFFFWSIDEVALHLWGAPRTQSLSRIVWAVLVNNYPFLCQLWRNRTQRFTVFYFSVKNVTISRTLLGCSPYQSWFMAHTCL